MSETITRMRLLEQWNSYVQEVLRDRSADERLILKRAFYAGAMSMFLLVMPEDEHDGKRQGKDAIIIKLEELDEELNRFQQAGYK